MTPSPQRPKPERGQPAADPLRERRLLRGAGLAVLLVTAAVFANSLGGGFVWVDHEEIEQGRFVIRSWEDFAAAWTRAVTDLRGGAGEGSPTSGYFRPVQILFVSLLALLFGSDPTLYHAPNILLHAASTLLLFWIAWRLSNSAAAAALCGLLFGVHPAHVESVTWIGGSKDVLSGFFFFASLASYVRWRGFGAKGPPQPGRKSGLPLAAVLLFGLGLLSKESVIVLPAVIVLLEVFFPGEGRPEGRPALLGRLRPAAAFGAVALLYLAVRAQVLGSLGDQKVWHGGGPVATLLTMPGILAEYAGKLLLPLVLTTADTTRIVRSPLDPVFLGGVFVLAVAAAAIVRGLAAARARRRAGDEPAGRRTACWAFGLAWFLAALLPAMNLLPVQHIKAERFLYLPSAGFVLAVAALWPLAGSWRRGGRDGRVERRRGLAAAAPAVAALLYAGFLAFQTIDRNGDWKNDITLFSRDVARTPNYREGHALLGYAHLEAGDLGRALQHLDAARHEDANFASYVNRKGVHYNRGLALMRLGDEARARGEEEPAQAAYTEALAMFRVAADLASSEALAFMNIGNALSSLGRADEAVESFDRAVQIDPENPLILFNRAQALYRAGRLGHALEDLEKAGRLAPDHAGTLNLKGKIHLGREKKDRAVECFRRSLELDPEQPRIRELLREAQEPEYLEEDIMENLPQIADDELEE